jgi:hypothetical protein
MKEPSPESSGGLTGALLGAVSRPWVVSAFWLDARSGAGTWFTLLLSSCLIGLLLGWLVGRNAGYRSSIQRPWTGPLIGALLGAGLWFLSSLVTLTGLCMLTSDHFREVNVGKYFIIMGAVGAFPGLCSGLMANGVRRKLADQSPDVHHGPVDGTSGSSD